MKSVRFRYSVPSAVLLAGLIGVILAWRIGGDTSGSAPISGPATSTAHWVDEAQCRSCHRQQAREWLESDHHLAMQRPSEESVRGDFNDRQFRGGDQRSIFFRKHGEFWIRTQQGDKPPEEFKVAYTFGWEPLQQYLLITENGRLQAYNVAWDTRKQEWFDLYAGEQISTRSRLLWREPAQNANFMCIGCHATGYKRNYDAANDRFDSHWQALGVGCQSCHGPASKHLEWAESGGKPIPGNGFAVSLTGPARSHEVETCARCHSRRAPLSDGFDHGHSLRDDFLVTGLTADLYEVDGTIQAEVYEYGTFVQSRMAAAGVVCSDCHNPHSGELRATGNAVCTQCHNPAGKARRAAIDTSGLRAGSYDSPAHHHHPKGSPGAQCVNCHMPGKVYMGTDLRHDHGFTTPNPRQALALGYSDACLGCHQPDDPDRLIEQFQRWYPDSHPRDGGYILALFKARNGKAGAAVALFEQLDRTDLPPLRRAALMAELPSYPSERARQALIDALQRQSPAVRAAAVPLIPVLFARDEAAARIRPLLEDPVKSVRIAAAWQMLHLTRVSGQPGWLAEYEAVQHELLARADAHFNLANVYRLTGRGDQVAPALRAALERDPDFFPAIIMLAQWLERAAGQPERARGMLEKNIARHPREASLRYALGLLLVRAGHYPEAVKALTRAHELAPDNANFAYVLAIARYDRGQTEEALQVLWQQVQADPADRHARLVLLNLLRRRAGAHEVDIQALLGELRRQNPWDPALPQAGRE